MAMKIATHFRSSCMSRVLVYALLCCLLLAPLSHTQTMEEEEAKDMIRVEIFSNGDSLAGINIELTADDGQKCWVVKGDGMAHYDPDSALERLEEIKARA